MAQPQASCWRRRPLEREIVWAPDCGVSFGPPEEFGLRPFNLCHEAVPRGPRPGPAKAGNAQAWPSKFPIARRFALSDIAYRAGRAPVSCRPTGRRARLGSKMADEGRRESYSITSLLAVRRRSLGLAKTDRVHGLDSGRPNANHAEGAAGGGRTPILCHPFGARMRDSAPSNRVSDPHSGSRLSHPNG